MSEPISFTFTGSIRFVFTPPLIATFLAAEIAVAVLAVLPVRPALVIRGMPHAPAQVRSVSPTPIAAPNSRAQSSDGHVTGSSERDIGRRSIHGR
jgi:hypothetical protein